MMPRVLALLLCLTPAAFAQPVNLDLLDAALIERGSAAFQQSCAVGYCHGSAGRAARGPALSDREWDVRELFRITDGGVPGSSMPAWNGVLPREEIWAITAYLMTLSTNPLTPDQARISLEQGAAQPSVELTGEAARGEELFFDLTREKRCGLCHQLRGQGTAIGPNLVAAAREKSAEQLRQDIVNPAARIAFGFEQTEVHLRSRERISGVLREDNPEAVRIYDTSMLPPVMRTFYRDEIRRTRTRRRRSSMPSGWHAIYAADELAAITTFLKALR